MLVPHSDREPRSAQLQVSAVLFLGFLVVVVLSSFVFLVGAGEHSGHSAAGEGARLRDAEASLEQLREEVVHFLHVYDDFTRVLADTLQRVDGALPGRGRAVERADLASLLRTDGIGDGQRRQLENLQDVVASLRAAIGPLGELSEALELHKELLSDLPNLWPVINGLGYVTMEFGPNIHPIQGIWYMHKGIDIAAYPGTPIVSAANGVVTDAGFDSVSGYGGFVEIKHNYGFQTKYSHLERVEIKAGDDVVQGQRIGTMGSTGMSTGTHLDFQIWIGTENLDPAYFLKLSKPDFNRRTRNRY